MKLDINPLSQLDPRWKDKKLGTSTSSIGEYGCALVCVTLLANYYTSSTLTPDEMNDKLVAVNGFASGNLLKWEALSAIFPQITFDRRVDCPDNPAPLDVVDQYLEARKPVIALVDYNPATKKIEQHFVLIVGKDAGDYFMADPMCQPGDGVYYLSARYGQPAKAICGLRLYSGPLLPQEPSESPTPPQDKDLEQEKQMNELTEKVVNNTNELRILSDKLSALASALDDIQKDVTTIYKDRDEITKISNRLTDAINRMDSLQASQTKAVTEMKTEFRLEIGDLEARIKKLENPPVQGQGEQFDVVAKFGRWFIGRRK